MPAMAGKGTNDEIAHNNKKEKKKLIVGYDLIEVLQGRKEQTEKVIYRSRKSSGGMSTTNSGVWDISCHAQASGPRSGRTII